MTGMLITVGSGDVATYARSSGAIPSGSPAAPAIRYEDALTELQNIQAGGRKARVPEVEAWQTFDNCTSDAWIYAAECSPENVERYVWPSRLYERIRTALRDHVAARPLESAGNIAAGNWARRLCEWCAAAQAALNVRFSRWLWNYLETDWGTYEGRPFSQLSASPFTGYMWSPRVRARLADMTEVATRREGRPSIVRPWLLPESCAWNPSTGRPFGPRYAQPGNYYFPLPVPGSRTGYTPDGQLGPRPISPADAARFGGGTNGWEMAGAAGLVRLGGVVYVPNREAMCELLAIEAQSYIDANYGQAVIRTAEAWFRYIEGFDLASLGLTPEELAAAGAAIAEVQETAVTGALTAAAGIAAAINPIAGVIAALFVLIVEAIGYARGSACPPLPKPSVLRTIDGDCLSVVQSGRAVGEAPLGTADAGAAVGLRMTFSPELGRALDSARARRDERNAQAAAQAAPGKVLLAAAAVGVVGLLLKGRAA